MLRISDYRAWSMEEYKYKCVDAYAFLLAIKLK